VTQNLSDQFEAFSFSGSEGTESILTLLNLIPDPAIIYNRAQDQILTANNAFFLLTNLEEREFVGKNIHAILPNITDTDPTTGHGQVSRLRHKRQPSMLVGIRIFSLAKSSDTVLILFHPEGLTLEMPAQEADHRELIQKFHKLIQSRLQENITAALGQVLATAQDLLVADLTCIYKASSSAPQLVQYLASDEALAKGLPNILTSEDLAIGQEPSLWTEDDLARSQLEKTAASAGYRFLVVVPLGQQSAKFGLFVAAGKNLPESEALLPMAALIADYTAGLMEDQIALLNTRTLTSKIKQVVKIQNEIISNLEEGILILTPELTVAEINQAAEEMLGYANVEALRQPVDNILIGSESFRSAFSSAKEGYPTLLGNLTLNHRHGRAFPAQVMTTPVLTNGKLVSIIVLIRDISQAEANQAEKRQLEQRAILGEGTAIFAHEVRNPLNAITLALQVIEDGLAEDDENIEWVHKIQEEVDNLIQLMESVLAFSKPLEYRMAGVDLSVMIKRLLERWRTRFVRVNIASYLESDIEHPIIEGDQRALEQVFTNLISNAVNAMADDGGYLSIKITEPDANEDQSFYQINVADSGPGIPEDIREHMFKPFVTGSKHGTGLGLAITQRIINAHKGKIEVESFPGGTIFKVFLAKKKD
jgi:PAS domain S-box-containing protein